MSGTVHPAALQMMEAAAAKLAAEQLAVERLAAEFPSWSISVALEGRVWTAFREWSERHAKRWIIGGSAPELLKQMRERISAEDR